jgi:5-bromo-4-chloroindolyl phosphate hydrolysis protein
VRDSLPEPDTFRLKHRAALIDVIGEIVRRNLKPSRKQVTSLAKPLVQAEDLSAFSKMALDDLKDLHEGNIARFRLRPSEFRRWQEK